MAFPRLNMLAFRLFLFGSLFAAAGFLTTVVCLRAPGLTMFRMPIFTRNVLLTAVLILYTLFGTVVYAMFAGFPFWWPKFTGTMLDERLGKITFWTLTVGFRFTFLVHHRLGPPVQTTPGATAAPWNGPLPARRRATISPRCPEFAVNPPPLTSITPPPASSPRTAPPPNTEKGEVALRDTRQIHSKFTERNGQPLTEG